MDQRVKLVAAGSVLLVGLLLAALFRREAPAGVNDRLELGRVAPSTVAEDVTPDLGPGSAAAGTTATTANPGRPTPVILAPASPGLPPVDEAHAATPARAESPSRWGTDLLLSQAAPKVPAVRTHKVVDGDSLRSLAERYLGAADRGAEIFEANRDVLSDPAILPIGTELKIVPAADGATDVLPRRPLVPVHRP